MENKKKSAITTVITIIGSILYIIMTIMDLVYFNIYKKLIEDDYPTLNNISIFLSCYYGLFWIVYLAMGLNLAKSHDKKKEIYCFNSIVCTTIVSIFIWKWLENHNDIFFR